MKEIIKVKKARLRWIPIYMVEKEVGLLEKLPPDKNGLCWWKINGYFNN